MPEEEPMPHTLEATRSPARVDAEVLHLDGFQERDPEVVNLVAGADEPESAVHRCLQTGARALGLAQVSLESALVEDAFSGMSREFDGKLGETVSQIDEITTRLLDKDTGELTVAL